MQLTSLMKTPELNALAQSPFNLHARLLKLIEREIAHAMAGSPGHIIAKINALVEPEIMNALYRASKAGVFIDLIVRGICCLRPGVPGMSDNIRVRSIVGRFLEHTRCYYFHNDGDVELYCSSADWMDRNFFRRIEVMWPIFDASIKQRILGDLDLYLSDNCQAWELQPDGSYVRVSPGHDEEVISAQATLLASLAEQS